MDDTPTPDLSPAALEALTALLHESNRWNAVLVARADRLGAMLARPGVADRLKDEEHHRELATSARLMDSLTTTLTAALARAEAAEALLREAGEVGALIERADERLDEIHDQDAGTWQLGGLFEVEELVCAAAGRARRLAAKIRGRG